MNAIKANIEETGWLILRVARAKKRGQLPTKYNWQLLFRHQADEDNCFHAWMDRTKRPAVISLITNYLFLHS